VGATCSVCEKPVTKDELEFEIQFAREALYRVPPDGRGGRGAV
jgi:hypothetical protein